MYRDPDAKRKPQAHVAESPTKGMETGELEEKFQPVLLVQTDTAGKLYLFTNKGNMMILPVTSVPESRMKDAGKSINALISGWMATRSS